MNVIDRLEDNIAVIETDGGFIEIERSRLPEDVREGDVVTETDGKWLADVTATEQRRKNIRELMKRLMKK
ncbi:MAG: DUF3006 domain-containing protein [Ruminococcus sp.]|nr:DUF3006 domain-containing protein [Ruminococcus sp.]